MAQGKQDAPFMEHHQEERATKAGGTFASRYISNALQELGLLTLWQATRDTHLLVLQRFIRLFAYGCSTLVLVPYLEALDNDPARIGLFMALTLLGDILISFVLTFFADALGRKMVLCLGSALMAVSGAVFATSSNFWMLLVAASLGVISPTANEVGPFRAVEESTLAHLTASASRADIFTWYQLGGIVGAALGMMSCGLLMNELSVRGWDNIGAFRVAFVLYFATGIVKLVLSAALSRKVEADIKTRRDDEASALLGEHRNHKVKTVRKKEWLPKISNESRAVVINLCLLFAVDAFAGGMANMSWTTHFFRYRFSMSEATIGSIFAAAAIVCAGSMLVAASVARRIGNVKTMVLTHLPSAIILALLPFPSRYPLAVTLLLVRFGTMTMDIGPRSAFLSAVVLPQERTAVMGIVNLVKTCSATLGPLVTGYLVENKLFWLAFVLAGGLQICYDLAILLTFASHRARGEHDDD